MEHKQNAHVLANTALNNRLWFSDLKFVTVGGIWYESTCSLHSRDYSSFSCWLIFFMSPHLLYITAVLNRWLGGGMRRGWWLLRGAVVSSSRFPPPPSPKHDDLFVTPCICICIYIYEWVGSHKKVTTDQGFQGNKYTVLQKVIAEVLFGKFYKTIFLQRFPLSIKTQSHRRRFINYY